jgi:hypothetical protein
MTGLANYLTIESLGKLEVAPGSNGASYRDRMKARSELPGAAPLEGTSQHPVGTYTEKQLPGVSAQLLAPVSDRVLQLQMKIRAAKAQRDLEAAEAAKRS